MALGIAWFLACASFGFMFFQQCGCASEEQPTVDSGVDCCQAFYPDSAKVQACLVEQSPPCINAVAVCMGERIAVHTGGCDGGS